LVSSLDCSRRLAEEQTGKRQVVVVAREVRGRTLPFIVPRESDAVPLMRAHVASGAIVHADESSAWERLHASYEVRRVNHSQEYKAEDGANVNQAESYFSRLRRAEIGQHHRISGHLLHQYADEAAWREDNRRRPNGTNWSAPGLAGEATKSNHLIKLSSVEDDGLGEELQVISDGALHFRVHR